MPQVFKPEIRNEIINPKKFWETWVVPRTLQKATEKDKEWPGYITVDKSLTPANVREHENGFVLPREATHDGTMIFTYDLLWETLQQVVFMKVVHNKFKGAMKRKEFNGVRYIIGHIHVECEAGTGVFLPVNNGTMTRGNREKAELAVISTPFMQH